MAQRSLNKVQLIGNLTRDPELRYTPQGTAVCSFGLATNRQWTTEAGEKREEAEFHRIVAWNKLAEICSQLLFKGRRVFVEGRLQTRQWTAQDGTPRQTTEIVISDMIILDSKRAPKEVMEPVPKEPAEMKEEAPIAEEKVEGESAAGAADDKRAAKVGEEPEEKKEEKSAKGETAEGKEEKVKPEDIPF